MSGGRGMSLAKLQGKFEIKYGLPKTQTFSNEPWDRIKGNFQLLFLDSIYNSFDLHFILVQVCNSVFQ
jgi:hypothetical protein